MALTCKKYYCGVAGLTTYTSNIAFFTPEEHKYSHKGSTKVPLHLQNTVVVLGNLNGNDQVEARDFVAPGLKSSLFHHNVTVKHELAWSQDPVPEAVCQSLRHKRQ